MLTLSVIVTVMVWAMVAGAQEKFESDVIKTSAGDLRITFLGHGTLMFAFGGKVIHVDPYSQVADYSKLPKADIILITHDHGDHFDPKVLSLLRTEKTVMILTNPLAKRVEGGLAMNSGDVSSIGGLKIEAIAAYNMVHKRGDGTPLHPKGAGNGYVITFGDKKIYVAGDTENIPEMKVLKDIDVAFLPMNLPFTMTPEMVTDAAKGFKPKILYPYHYGNTDPSGLVVLLKDTKEIEVRIRKMK
jgi:L-ascorbate metabolism protein UlaG (beta-lactamase superfamily)